jgi:hypothetical protein
MGEQGRISGKQRYLPFVCSGNSGKIIYFQI